MEMLRYGFVVLPKDIAKSLLIGLVIAGLITVLIPPNSLESILGGGILAMLLMVAISVPMYVCATASVPIAAAMVLAGVSFGGAFVFLVAGPATNAATVATIGRALGKRTATLYIAILALGAVLGGLALDAFYRPKVQLDFHQHGEMFPEWFTTTCAIALLAMIAYALYPARKQKTPQDESEISDEPGQVTLHVEGMSCEHCRSSVESALLKQAGVTKVSVDLVAATALVTGENYQVAELLSAVNGAGFTAKVPG